VRFRPFLHLGHGEDGLDRKGESEGNASYYYSFPRLETAGTITVSGGGGSDGGGGTFGLLWSLLAAMVVALARSRRA
jgi:hypothetical protein